jgi:hypothetical protein
MFIVQCRIVQKCSDEKPLSPPAAWRIPPVEDTIRSVVEDLLDGQYNNPVRVIGFNATERTSRDVTSDVVKELRQCCVEQNREPPEFLHELVSRSESQAA